MSITPTGDGVAGLSVTAQAGTAGETAEVTNNGSTIVVELFNAVPTVPQRLSSMPISPNLHADKPSEKLSTGRGT
ncbi:hypothetical protein HQO42_19720 [Rhodococcus fascians]|nr:hypothetical protein [Rhodococcus fascians]MBY4238973.1 hypothetical protein [Rhodococcus fascians]MBY4254882.1 hypothetical protein [Rhodococcus fascians]MBY4270424.1 hypothetical protein [Rhodococcus fascians]